MLPFTPEQDFIPNPIDHVGIDTNAGPLLQDSNWLREKIAAGTSGTKCIAINFFVQLLLISVSQPHHTLFSGI